VTRATVIGLCIGTFLVFSEGPILAAESRPAAASVSPQAVDFFEKKIRPILVERCFECHSSERGKIKGSLVLDTAEGLRKGGDGGTVITPGEPDKSRLIQAVRYKDENLQMPPKEMLASAQIADLEAWVRMGAPDPRTQPATFNPQPSTKTNHWAFQPPKRHALPKIKEKKWPRDPIDFFILSELEDRRIRPAPPADRRTLIRRATFDLIGLPPTPEEIDTFLADTSPNAFGKVIDRLLASPHFGERWGRHWLDVARYADSNGLEQNVPYPNAWRYRDYVGNAFNHDKPFDQFIREQIAGDLLPEDSTEERLERIIATGFLMLGPKVLFEPNPNKLTMDVVDEQIDVTTRAFLGLTVSCARCHDHKYDPIPTRDYYAMAGIFKSTASLATGRGLPNNPNNPRWMERPLGNPEQTKALEEYEAKLSKLETARQKAREQKTAFPGNIDSTRLTGIVVDNLVAEIIGNWKESIGSTNFVDRNYLGDGNAEKGKKSVRFVAELPKSGPYEVLVSYPPFWNRSTNVPVTIECAEGTNTVFINQTQPPTIDRIFVSVGMYKFAAGTNAAVTISNKGTKGFVVADAVRFEPVESMERSMAMRPRMATAKPNEAELPAPDLYKLDDEIFELRDKAPPPMPTAMAVLEGTPGNCQVNVRGDPDRLGDEVPRGFIQRVADRGGPRSIDEKSSGRLELAGWIASPENPLTARVAVNRLWLHLFGRGLVDTPDNFGILSEAPTHPELLDHLALRLIEQGWSVKKMIRIVMLSSAYQMSSEHDTAAYAKDPDNRTFWRMNRRRLEAEAVRDAMLALSGQLDRTFGGSLTTTNNVPMVDLSMNQPPVESNRRSLYLPVIRNNLGDLFQVFDFPDPHVVSGKRHTTTAPTQALFVMNSPFVQEQARRWAEAIQKMAVTTEPDRVSVAYVQAIGRPPSRQELERALRFVANASKMTSESDTYQRVWQQFCHALLASTEFRFVD